MCIFKVHPKENKRYQIRYKLGNKALHKKPKQNKPYAMTKFVWHCNKNLLKSLEYKIKMCTSRFVILHILPLQMLVWTIYSNQSRCLINEDNMKT